MNDLGNLLQSILDLLKSWAGSFSDYATAVMEKLNLIEEDTDNLDDIKDNTDDIKDNTGAIIIPVQSIQSTNTTIATNTTTIKNSVSAMSNQLTTISTNVGTASAYTEDIANNTLDCKNRLVTIGSDTTQIRTDSDSIASDVAEIKDTLGLYLYNTIVTEDVEGAVANFDTDLKDYLQEAKVTIPADAGGISNLLIVNQLTEQAKATAFRGLLNGTCFFQHINLTGKTYTTANGYDSWAINLDRGSITASNPSNKFISIPIPYRYQGSEAQVNHFYLTPTVVVLYMVENTFRDGEFDVIYPLETPIIPTITKAQFETASSAFGIDLNDYSVSFTAPITDGAEVDLLSGVVKINTSPVTYDSITPLAIRTFKEVNNIYSDVGDISVTYRETLKHYLEKQN